MDNLVIALARGLILLPVLVTLYIVWKLDTQNRKKYIVILVAGGILSLIMAKVTAHIYTNPRPQFKDHATPLFIAAHYNGFPSDHTLLSAFLGFAAFFYSRKYAYALLAVAAIIGWARVVAHVHHLVDIIASFLITAVAYAVAKFLVDKYLKNSVAKDVK